MCSVTPNEKTKTNRAQIGNLEIIKSNLAKERDIILANLESYSSMGDDLQKKIVALGEERHKSANAIVLMKEKFDAKRKEIELEQRRKEKLDSQ